MPFTKERCSECGKVAESTSQYSIGTKIVHMLKCSHMLVKDAMSSSGAENLENFTSLSGKKPYKFQIEGIQFVEKSGGRCLIADEMGLGKTIQALGAIALHEEMLNVAYFVKAGLKLQWQHEIMEWLSTGDGEEGSDGELALAQVIDTPKDMLLPGCKHFIFSLDLLRRYKNGELAEKLKKRKIRTIVIDECQHIKNPESQRTREVRDLCRGVENVIALSGTPIKNHAGEYFSVLNILKPEMYPSHSRFIYNECQAYHNGYGYKVGGLKFPERFKEKTASFIIRREREEVLPDLPKIRRTFQFHELGKEVEKEYTQAFVEFRDDYFTNGASSFADSSNILAYLSRMRHITGRSKVKPCVEFVEEFLDSTDRKITIFVHHKDVGELVREQLQPICEQFEINAPLYLISEMDAYARDETVNRFKADAKNRILVASTLASGEGLNLQFCSDCIVLERQWNPANEEQAEGRFSRIGSLAEAIAATYFVAVGTVDEFFARLVEEKREICTKTMGGQAVKWDQSSLMKELAEVLAVQGGRAWNL